MVPSSYNTIYEAELCAAGVAICIYANHLLRASYPAMLAAESILTHQRSKEVDDMVMPIKQIITLVGEDGGVADPAAATEPIAQLRGGSTTPIPKPGRIATDRVAADCVAASRRRPARRSTPSGCSSHEARAEHLVLRWRAGLVLAPFAPRSRRTSTRA